VTYLRKKKRQVKNLHLIRFSVHVSSVLLAVIFFLSIANPAWARGLAAVNAAPITAQPVAQSPAQALQAIKKFVDAQPFSSETARIDFIRNWVNQNSIHLIDAEHNQYAFKTPKVLVMLWQTHLTAQAPAHLSCGPRALAMQAILKELGIPSRAVFIFTDNYNQVMSHTFLEVLNRDTGAWEVQDPDFNIYYVDLRTQKRVATAALVWGDLDVLVPQSATTQGWAENKVAHLKQDYFETMMYLSQQTEKYVILINRARFDPSKVFVDNGKVTFYTFANRAYKAPIIRIK
jgi:hypothetical protein